jgi:hypothetical protein
MFELPTTFTSDISANATDAISALSPYTTLILGVLLAVLVISVIVSTLTHHK